MNRLKFLCAAALNGVVLTTVVGCGGDKHKGNNGTVETNSGGVTETKNEDRFPGLAEVSRKYLLKTAEGIFQGLSENNSKLRSTGEKIELENQSQIKKIIENKYFEIIREVAKEDNSRPPVGIDIKEPIIYNKKQVHWICSGKDRFIEWLNETFISPDEEEKLARLALKECLHNIYKGKNIDKLLERIQSTEDLPIIVNHDEVLERHSEINQELQNRFPILKTHNNKETRVLIISKMMCYRSPYLIVDGVGALMTIGGFIDFSQGSITEFYIAKEDGSEDRTKSIIVYIK